MKSQSNKWLFIAGCIGCLVFMGGCGKPEPENLEQFSTTQDGTVIDENSSAVSLSVSREELDNEIKANFSQIQDFIYPHSHIVNQEKNLTDKGLYQTKEEGDDQAAVRHATVISETSDTINQILEYYRRKYPEEHFKLYQKDGKIRTVSFIHVTEFDRKTNERLEVKLKINTPYMSFSQEIVDKQIIVIQNQIMQYENILRLQSMQRDVPKNQDAKSVFFEKKIKELLIQAAALKNKTTLITLAIQYLAYTPTPDASSGTE